MRLYTKTIKKINSAGSVYGTMMNIMQLPDENIQKATKDLIDKGIENEKNRYDEELHNLKKDFNRRLDDLQLTEECNLSDRTLKKIRKATGPGANNTNNFTVAGTFISSKKICDYNIAKIKQNKSKLHTQSIHTNTQKHKQERNKW